MTETFQDPSHSTDSFKSFGSSSPTHDIIRNISIPTENEKPEELKVNTEFKDPGHSPDPQSVGKSTLPEKAPISTTPADDTDDKLKDNQLQPPPQPTLDWISANVYLCLVAAVPVFWFVFSRYLACVLLGSIAGIRLFELVTCEYQAQTLTEFIQLLLSNHDHVLLHQRSTDRGDYRDANNDGVLNDFKRQNISATANRMSQSYSLRPALLEQLDRLSTETIGYYIIPWYDPMFTVPIGSRNDPDAIGKRHLSHHESFPQQCRASMDDVYLNMISHIQAKGSADFSLDFLISFSQTLTKFLDDIRLGAQGCVPSFMAMARDKEKYGAFVEPSLSNTSETLASSTGTSAESASQPQDTQAGSTISNGDNSQEADYKVPGPNNNSNNNNNNNNNNQQQQQHHQQQDNSSGSDGVLKAMRAYLDSHPHCQLARMANPASQENRIRSAADQFVSKFVPRSHLESPLLRTFLQEVIAYQVVVPTIEKLSDPRYINATIISVLQDRPPTATDGEAPGEDDLSRRISGELASQNISLDAPMTAEKPADGTKNVKQNPFTPPSSEGRVSTDASLSPVLSRNPSNPRPNGDGKPKVSLLDAEVTVSALGPPVGKLAVGRKEPRSTAHIGQNYEFIITIEPRGHGGWMTMRSVKDVRVLHEKLVKLARLAGVFDFPQDIEPRKGISGEGYGSQLEKYLNSAVKHPELASTDALWRFCEKRDMDAPSPPASGVGHHNHTQSGSRGDGNLSGDYKQNSKRFSKSSLQLESQETLNIMSEKLNNVFNKSIITNLKGGLKLANNQQPQQQQQPQPQQSPAKSIASVSNGIADKILPSEKSSDSLSTMASKGHAQSASSTKALSIKEREGKDGSQTPPRLSLEQRERFHLPPPPSEIDEIMIKESLANGETQPGLAAGVSRSNSIANGTSESATTTSNYPSIFTMDETVTIINHFFSVFDRLYALSQASSIRRSFLGVVKTLFVKGTGNNSYLASFSKTLNVEVGDKLANQDHIAMHLKYLIDAMFPATSHDPDNVPQPTISAAAELDKARTLFVTRAVPELFTRIIGGPASQEALGILFDVLQDRTLARGLVTGLVLDLLWTTCH